MSKSSEYWARRYKLIEQACHDISLEYLEEMEKKYRDAEQTIQAKINAWYGRFAVNNNISMSEARKWLNDKELDELKWNVEQYIKYGKQNAIDGKWEKELENASAKFHISRLEALKLECRQQIEQLTGGMTDDVDSVMQDTYREGYYRSMYEVQKGVSVGFDVAALDKNLVKRIVNKPWHIDGSDFSSSIWSNKAKLLGTLDKEISKMVLTGSSPEKTIRAIQNQMHTSKSNAQRLVLTESAYFTTRAQADSYSELGVELYEVVATLDKRTCDVCGSFDGKKYPLSEMEVGVNAPPFHPRCRCTTCPYDEDSDVFGVGTRAARDENGKTVSVPGDMTFEEWKKKFVGSPVVVDQTQKITKKKSSNDYSVDRKLANSKEFHDKFESLTEHKTTNEAVYQEAMKMLEHRDGTDLEDIVIFDARTGNVIVKNTLSTRSGQTGLTYEQYEIYQQASGKKVLLHNHPNGGRLSFTDLKTLFMNDDIEASIVVGHNGMVHIASNPDRTIDIEKLYASLYNEYKEIYADSNLSRIYALDYLYDLKIFDYESR